MRIEMCGPPTAGKSQLVKTLKQMGITRGPKTTNNSPPKEWFPFAEFVRETYKTTTYKKLPTKTLMSLASAWMGDKTPKPIVFDELVILCGFSMAIRLPKECSDRYFAEAPLPAILVYLTADNDILMKRNAARGERSRPEKTMRMVRACEHYVPVLKERGCRILTFDTSNVSTTAIARNIIEEIGAK